MKAGVAAESAAARVHTALADALRGVGLDVCTPFSLKRYNDVAPPVARIPTSSFGTGEATLGIMFGNSRRMWGLFLNECRRDAKLLNSTNPLDTYVKRVVSQSVETVAPGQTVKVYWGNDRHEGLEGGEGYVSVQRLAEGVGLCYLDSNTHLCMHPVYGSWFSLRGFLLMDGLVFDTQTTYDSVPNPLTAQQEKRVADAIQEAMRPAEGATEGGATYKGLRENWRKWLLVRQCLHDGKHPWEYDEQQTVYHYTSDKEVLRRCVAECASND